MLALIFVCNVLRIKDSVAPSCVIFSVIVFLHAGSTLDTLPYVFERMIETIIGVLIALPVNRFFFNPRPKNVPEPPEGCLLYTSAPRFRFHRMEHKHPQISEDRRDIETPIPARASPGH